MSRVLVAWKAFLVTATIVTGGTAVADVIGAQTAGIAILVVAGLNAGTDYYVNNTTVPKSEAVPRGEVMARQTDPGSPVLATPAAQAAYGIPAGSVVDVNPTAVAPGTGPGTPT